MRIVEAVEGAGASGRPLRLLDLATIDIERRLRQGEAAVADA